MATEKRLIDANALIKKVESYTQLIVDVKHDRDMFYHGSGWNGALVSARVAIKDMPTVDAVEVVHGRWVSGGNLIPTTNGLRWTVRCNLCGCPQDFKHNYCPNCGAKMDGAGNG